MTNVFVVFYSNAWEQKQGEWNFYFPRYKICSTERAARDYIRELAQEFFDANPEHSARGLLDAGEIDLTALEKAMRACDVQITLERTSIDVMPDSVPLQERTLYEG